jgi:hypothetical protein
LAPAAPREARPGPSWPVHVDEAQASGLHPAKEDRGEAFHQLVAELRILLALAPQADAVEDHGPDRLQCPPVELPAIRGEEPGEADHLPRFRAVQDHGTSTGGVDLQRDSAAPHDEHLIGLVTLPEEVRARLEHDVAATSGDELDVWLVQPAEEGMLAKQRTKSLDGHA